MSARLLRIEPSLAVSRARMETVSPFTSFAIVFNFSSICGIDLSSFDSCLTSFEASARSRRSSRISACSCASISRARSSAIFRSLRHSLRSASCRCCFSSLATCRASFCNSASSWRASRSSRSMALSSACSSARSLRAMSRSCVSRLLIVASSSSSSWRPSRSASSAAASSSSSNAFARSAPYSSNSAISAAD